MQLLPSSERGRHHALCMKATSQALFATSLKILLQDAVTNDNAAIIFNINKRTIGRVERSHLYNPKLHCFDM